jgi:tetratricopeptide (TPR) repeat protein
MAWQRHFTLVVTAIFLITSGICGLWWFYWPSYHRSQVLKEAERLLSSGQIAEADTIVLASLKSELDDMPMQFLHARILRRLGQHAQAGMALARATKLGLPEKDGMREFVLNEASGNFNRLEPALKQLLESNPDDVEVEEALAEGYGRSQRWQEAERANGRMLELEPGRHEIRLARGKARLELGRYDGAAADFKEYLANVPDHFEARLLLAHCFLSNTHIAEAQKELSQCRRLQPTHPGPLIGLANCALEMGELENAQTLIQEARILGPGDPLVLHVQGSLYLRRRRYDLAVPLYETILKSNPRDKQAHLKLAQALSQTGEQKRAQEHQEAFQQLDREDAERERRRRVGGPATHAAS